VFLVQNILPPPLAVGSYFLSTFLLYFVPLSLCCVLGLRAFPCCTPNHHYNHPNILLLTYYYYLNFSQPCLFPLLVSSCAGVMRTDIPLELLFLSLQVLVP
jgi:hypothetical protein